MFSITKLTHALLDDENPDPAHILELEPVFWILPSKKKFRITLISTVLCLHINFLSLKTDVNVSKYGNQQKTLVKTYFLLAS